MTTQPPLRVFEPGDPARLHRDDLQALVDVLAHDAFAIDDRGLAARRALRQLSRVLDTHVAFVQISSE